MDTKKLTDLVEDEVLNQLPDEAIDHLLELSKTEGDHEMEINVILKRYGINPVEIAKSLTEKEKGNE